MTNAPSPLSYTGPASRILLGDLDKTITVGEALDAFEQALAELSYLVEGRIEHWTDDEGLHVSPFQDDLETTLREELTHTFEANILGTMRG